MNPSMELGSGIPASDAPGRQGKQESRTVSVQLPLRGRCTAAENNVPRFPRGVYAPLLRGSSEGKDAEESSMDGFMRLPRRRGAYTPRGNSTHLTQNKRQVHSDER